MESGAIRAAPDDYRGGLLSDSFPTLLHRKIVRCAVAEIHVC